MTLDSLDQHVQRIIMLPPTTAYRLYVGKNLFKQVQKRNSLPENCVSHDDSLRLLLNIYGFSELETI